MCCSLPPPSSSTYSILVFKCSYLRDQSSTPEVSVNLLAMSVEAGSHLSNGLCPLISPQTGGQEHALVYYIHPYTYIIGFSTEC
ncbi:hypothetical protein CFIMG_000047RA [Ceratocystis fimbriata CBS 114723]|uniref:Uncharacterized protein n=1 Tax=Ceratocystis fimbriata CBS 114723 TaxID=1035309 RepID=A0A2C5XGI9_9PEZI|nr:hypothetical protein CFIMG_000047RA [Ceratocystis fimbriata CBS 114723]